MGITGYQNEGVTNPDNVKKQNNYQTPRDGKEEVKGSMSVKSFHNREYTNRF